MKSKQVGVDFTNILRKAFKIVDSKSVKMIVQVMSHFVLLQSTPVKAARKHVGEIDPWCKLHLHFICKFCPKKLQSLTYN